MIRLQIQLSEEQADRLRRLAADRHRSLAALIRESLDRTLGDVDSGGAWERALAAVATGSSGHRDVSVEHDRYLDEAFAE